MGKTTPSTSENPNDDSLQKAIQLENANLVKTAKEAATSNFVVEKVNPKELYKEFEDWHESEIRKYSINKGDIEQLFIDDTQTPKISFNFRRPCTTRNKQALLVQLLAHCSNRGVLIATLDELIEKYPKGKRSQTLLLLHEKLGSVRFLSDAFDNKEIIIQSIPLLFKPYTQQDCATLLAGFYKTHPDFFPRKLLSVYTILGVLPYIDTSRHFYFHKALDSLILSRTYRDQVALLPETLHEQIITCLDAGCSENNCITALAYCESLGVKEFPFDENISSKNPLSLEQKHYILQLFRSLPRDTEQKQQRDEAIAYCMTPESKNSRADMIQEAGGTLEKAEKNGITDINVITKIGIAMFFQKMKEESALSHSIERSKTKEFFFSSVEKNILTISSFNDLRVFVSNLSYGLDRSDFPEIELFISDMAVILATFEQYDDLKKSNKQEARVLKKEIEIVLSYFTSIAKLKKKIPKLSFEDCIVRAQRGYDLNPNNLKRFTEKREKIIQNNLSLLLEGEDEQKIRIDYDEAHIEKIIRAGLELSKYGYGTAYIHKSEGIRRPRLFKNIIDKVFSNIATNTKGFSDKSINGRRDLKHIKIDDVEYFEEYGPFHYHHDALQHLDAFNHFNNFNVLTEKFTESNGTGTIDISTYFFLKNFSKEKLTFMKKFFIITYNKEIKKYEIILKSKSKSLQKHILISDLITYGLVKSTNSLVENKKYLERIISHIPLKKKNAGYRSEILIASHLPGNITGIQLMYEKVLAKSNHIQNKLLKSKESIILKTVSVTDKEKTKDIIEYIKYKYPYFLTIDLNKDKTAYKLIRKGFGKQLQGIDNIREGLGFTSLEESHKILEESIIDNNLKAWESFYHFYKEYYNRGKVSIERGLIPKYKINSGLLLDTESGISGNTLHKDTIFNTGRYNQKGNIVSSHISEINNQLVLSYDGCMKIDPSVEEEIKSVIKSGTDVQIALSNTKSHGTPELYKHGGSVFNLSIKFSNYKIFKDLLSGFSYRGFTTWAQPKNKYPEIYTAITCSENKNGKKILNELLQSLQKTYEDNIALFHKEIQLIIDDVDSLSSYGEDNFTLQQNALRELYKFHPTQEYEELLP